MLDHILPFHKTGIWRITVISIMMVICCGAYALPALTARELIMITSQHCPYCMAWERDIGAVYDKSPYADNLLLIRFGSDLPEDVKISSDLRGTPTFLILDRVEIDRIIGYSDAEMFLADIRIY